MSDLKQNVQLLGRMYISCVAHGGDVEDFMKHENLPHPPALAEGGELRGGTKVERSCSASIQITNPLGC